MRIPRKDVTNKDRFDAINDLSIAIADVLSNLSVWGDYDDLEEYRPLMKNVRACWRLLRYIVPRIGPLHDQEFNPSGDMLSEDIMHCIQPLMSDDARGGEPFDWGHRGLWSEDEHALFITQAAEPFRELRKTLRGWADSIMCAEITELFEPWRSHYAEKKSP